MRQRTIDDLAREGPVERQAVADGRRGESDTARLLEVAREATEVAEAANRAKDEFLAMLSHEMRSPLAAMAIWASLLRKGTLPPDQAAHAIEALERNLAILSRFTGEILDESRIVTGKLALDVRSVDLAAVIDAALDTVRAAADAKGIVLEKLIETSERIEGDSTRLQQVVSNLLTNAVNFSERGGRVLLRIVAEGSHVVISVRDMGEGIASDLLPHVFEPYRQVHGTSARVHGGLGLGLSLVHEIVALHHGAVHAASAGPGRGSTFSVTLPIVACPGEVQLDGTIVLAPPKGESRFVVARRRVVGAGRDLRR